MKIFSFKERLLQIFLLTLMALALIYMSGGFESANTTQSDNDKNAPIRVTDINADFKKKKLLDGPWKYNIILEEDGSKISSFGYVAFEDAGEFAEISEIQIFGPGGELLLGFTMEIEGKWHLVNSAIYYTSTDISVIPSTEGPPPPYTSSDISEMEAELESSPTKIIKIDECGMVTEEDGHLGTYIKYYYDSNGNLKPKC